MEKTQTPARDEMELSHHWIVVTGRYKPLSHIGKGTFGLVVKAKHRSSKKIVAIKFIKNSFSDKHLSKSILREICILRQLSAIK